MSCKFLQSGNTALRAATALGDAECIFELLKHGADVNLETFRGTALIAASTHGDVDTLLLLLDQGATVDLETAVGKVLARSARGDTGLHAPHDCSQNMEYRYHSTLGCN